MSILDSGTDNKASDRGASWWAPALLVVAGLVLAAWAVTLVRSSEPETVRASLSAAEAIAGGDTAGFARATRQREYTFPEDHGPHPDYRTEWWYVTGHLDAEGGRSFGFQLTFFRNTVVPDSPDRQSAWSTNQTWLAHFAVTDIESGEHVYGERVSRGAAGLAGGQVDPFRVWLDDWELSSVDDGSFFPLRLRARQGDVALDLELGDGHPMVPQGDRGLSQKGPEPGNASHYLTWPRMPVTGDVFVDDVPLTVSGQAWLDREWSTSALGEAHVGWDWFSVQLDDGRNLMFFELRRDDGEPDPLNHGSVSGPDGLTRTLTAGDVRIEVLDTWASRLDGAEYPSGWRVFIPAESLELEIQPRVLDQEMNVSFRYWEGAVDVRGMGEDGPVRGLGYVELTGYGEEARVRGTESGAASEPAGATPR